MHISLNTDLSMVNMGTLADTEVAGSDIYVTLGLTELGKGVTRPPQILQLVSLLLEKAVKKNEVLLDTMQIKDVITMFHGLRAPTLSIRQYIDRIFKYSGCSPSCFIVAHIYIDRFIQRMNVPLTSLNIHRLLITSVVVAAKFIDDAFFNNAYYAKVGGVGTRELNRLEMKFLFSLDFRLYVSVETFQKHCFHLEKEATLGLQIERPILSCGIKENWPHNDDSTYAPAIAR